ncbi:DUF3261 domain-containing protein [Shewanella avicenniae]|uniref:DUF3261 domain-containing protein n=1 Tax=Shewanella avicenniae TaxID=2814294 RepID=A0ABX7QRM5_9GAMM|nr:DUF3261 domain-containing protein [Shewanella avicenniae]QSX33919.1 DUF3261 domain-containing protein [Shewanella avicenniae]
MHRWLLMFAFTLLAGCQQLRHAPASCVSLTAEVSQCLAPLPWQQSNALPPDDLVQLVRFNRAESQQELTVSLSFTTQAMTVVGLAPLGQALFSLTFDGHSLSSEQSMLLGNQFRADYLLAMLQLVYWPTELLQASINGAELTEVPCGQSQCRQLHRDGKLIALVTYQQADHWHSEAVLQLPAANIMLTITPL